MDQEFKRWPHLLKMIEAGARIELTGYIFNNIFRLNLEKFVKLCLENYDKNDLVPFVCSVIQEMLSRAGISNLREHFSQENGIDFLDQNSFDYNEEEFRKFLNTLDPRSVRDSLKTKGLFLKVIIRHNRKRFSAEVLNNSKAIPFMEEFLKQYVAFSMEYKDLMDYYQFYPEDKEGRNLGLAFSILTLREIGLRPELSRVSTGEGIYAFRIEIPLGEEYGSIREQILNDKEIFPFPKDNRKRENEPPWQTNPCSHCGRTVDDRILFSKIPDDIPIKNIPKSVQTENKICAWCVASYL
ncbi:hypothetical protein M9Y82_04935 [Leptospira weilii]|uniref:Uncharacterized protein n=3 Tax=Leptospira weilii TaxID=28184 RepID=N1UBM6_9LEPT|nr:hypothetical protein [Leptospira weilii]EMM72882.1 hypothetical protein LEP1GSC038_3524 [Leptospira weilii str. 2006001855]EMY13440.1 hypothetical protein LEP1GSC043_2014 [Leptospira weilii str. Ecochallenge]EMN89274.1 hypothetical protein LEP1GSC108_4495 [Leptospira weilii str. UI 13098]MCL8266007.1 hypothetical protein [Leptospira weilii]MDL5244226.1 hypothetical protein [Leptospira weilii]